MKHDIWIVTIGEPIFHPENKLRKHRSGLLAKFISENKNCNVTWWTSTFNHFTKKHEYEKDTEVQINDNFKMIAIKGTGYSKNVSLSRLKDNQIIRKKMKRLFEIYKPPSIIISSFPTMGLCELSLSYGKNKNIPVLIDYRDMWPEVYVDLFPGLLKNVAKILFYPLFYKANKIFKNATGVIGITSQFLDEGLKKANRQKTYSDNVFPLVYKQTNHNNKNIKNAEDYWSNQINLFDKKKLRICYFGAIGFQSNWESIIDSIKLINENNLNVEFIICGTGDKLDELKNKSKNLNGIYFPGFINSAQIEVLMNHSDLGLCAYYPKQNYMESIPGKAVEYMYGGLKIISTLEEGKLGKFIKENNLGYHYNHDNSNELFLVIKEALKNKKNEKNNIKNIFKNNFDSDLIFEKYYNHILDVIK